MGTPPFDNAGPETSPGVSGVAARPVAPVSEGADDAFWSNTFHACALAAGFIAAGEGRLADSPYVKRLCYALYEAELAERSKGVTPIVGEPTDRS